MEPLVVVYVCSSAAHPTLLHETTSHDSEQNFSSDYVGFVLKASHHLFYSLSG